MPEICGEHHPERIEVTCEKWSPCYRRHVSHTHQTDWPSDKQRPDKASRKAEAAGIAGNIKPAKKTGPPEGKTDGLDPRTHARKGDPDTSHDAASKLSDQTTMMRTLLIAFTDGPLTAEEAADWCGYDPWASSKRVSDLALAGYIEDTGLRRPGESGREQIVRAITDKGVAALLSDEPLKPSTTKRPHSCWATEMVAEVRALEKDLVGVAGAEGIVARLREILGYEAKQPAKVLVPDYDPVDD
jgi:hypothetical protein